MDNPNININVSETATPVLLGRDVITLQDETEHVFRTNDMGAFVSYCKDVGTAEKKIYFCSEKVRMIVAKPDRYTEPTAECEVVQTPFVKLLVGMEDHAMNLMDFEELLFTMRPFLDEGGLALYSYVRNFSASKVTSVKREVDNKGNFCYNVTREKGGPTDVEIPETLTFNIPMIENAKNMTLLTFDVYFSWKDQPDGCNVIFKLKNPLLGMEVKFALKQSLSDVMEELDCPKYWGKLDAHRNDNSWRYVFNGIDEVAEIGT